MQSHKKTFFASVVAVFIGTSCCWLSAIAMWFGGLSFLGFVIHAIEDFQLQLLIVSGTLGVISIVLFRRNSRNKNF